MKSIMRWLLRWLRVNKVILRVILLLSLVLCFRAESSQTNLKDGIQFFYLGEFEKAKMLFEDNLNDEQGVSTLYLGLLYDPEFNREPFKDVWIKYNKENEVRVKNYYQSSIAKGNIYASYFLGSYYRTMVVKRQNYKRSKNIWQKVIPELKSLTNKGDWKASFMLAKIFGDKNGLRIHSERALVLLKEAANDGDHIAQLYLGRAYSERFCVMNRCRNLKEGLKWFLISSMQGNYFARWRAKNLSGIMDKSDVNDSVQMAQKYIDANPKINPF